MSETNVEVIDPVTLQAEQTHKDLELYKQFIANTVAKGEDCQENFSEFTGSAEPEYN